MTTFHEQACPLCDSPAEYGWVDMDNRKYFDCVTCGPFQISKRAERLLIECHVNRKAEYASLAKQTPPEHLLVIRMPDQEFRQHSNDELQATYVPKSDLPLNCR